MAAGDSARQRARELERLAAEWEQRRRAAWDDACRYGVAADSEQLVAATLLALPKPDWNLLADRQWPGSPTANVDMILVGPPGVYVIDVKRWRDVPQIVDGELRAGMESRQSSVGKLLALSQRAEEAVADMQMSPVAVTPLMVFDGHDVDLKLGRVRLLGVRQVVPAVLADSLRIQPPTVRAVTRHLEDVFPEYTTHRPARPAARPAAPVGERPALFDIDDVVQATVDSALAGPLDSWMTFLHPAQVGLVRKRWTGPARISGAAGTGKTVVGLHRAAYVAGRATNPVLFVTFNTNLRKVNARSLNRLAPQVAERIECTSLHRLARRLLEERGIEVRPHKQRVETCFSLAWMAVRSGSPLARLESSPQYWRDEIGYVIKGRGITSFEEYARLPRPGRRTPLQQVHRQAVWQLYEEYERRRVEANVHDFEGLLLLALEQVRAEPVRPGYAAVVVDEVQDLTLNGIRLLHALAGDRLLLIGDGQQQVYPGGFRLTEAGIDLRGRAERLRVNYRNAANILDAALAIVDGHEFEDLDGTVHAGKPDVETSHHDGAIIRANAPTKRAHDELLLARVRELAAQEPPTLGDAALLCARIGDVDDYAARLAKAGVPTVELNHYDGEASDHLKVGTYRRAKGLEFKHVLLPMYDEELRRVAAGSFTEADRRALAVHQLFVAMTRARDSLWLGSVDPQTSHVQAGLPR